MEYIDEEKNESKYHKVWLGVHRNTMYDMVCDSVELVSES